MLRNTNKTKWLALVLGVLLGLAALNYALGRFVVKSEDIAFGTETTGLLGGIGDTTMHCMDSRDSGNCVKSYAKAGTPPAILWLGNSQLAGINRYQEGDENAPQILHKSLLSRGQYLVIYSQPNANLLEHALVYTAVAPKFDTKLLMMPVVFDDIREHGVREHIANFAQDKSIRDTVDTSALAPFLNPSIASAMSSQDTDTPVKDRSLQKTSESKLTSWLEKHSRLWAARPALKGTLSSAIHQLRNKALGIHSTTKRAVPQNVYKERMQVLEIMLENARTTGIDVLLYVPPYRRDIDGPYIEDQYTAFKSDLMAIAKRTDAHYLDIETIVPGPEWATVTDRIFGFKEPDFMHFTAAGHQRLAGSLDTQLKAMGY